MARIVVPQLNTAVELPVAGDAPEPVLYNPMVHYINMALKGHFSCILNSTNFACEFSLSLIVHLLFAVHFQVLSQLVTVHKDLPTQRTEALCFPLVDPLFSEVCPVVVCQIICRVTLLPTLLALPLNNMVLPPVLNHLSLLHKYIVTR